MRALPDEVREALERVFGPIRRLEGLSGGSISSAYRVELVGGSTIFLKYDRAAPPTFFSVEAAGLSAIRDRSSLRVPEVLAVREMDDGLAWLATEWLQSSARDLSFDTSLGAGLAELHRNRGGSWGWDRSGFIGRLHQSNRPCGSWPDFWWSQRIKPQLDLARRAGFCHEGDWETLSRRLEEWLAPAEVDGPSLLHGDLWQGNVLGTAAGPALIDPSCYYGHREVDLAMAHLFGGFGSGFYEGYAASWPLSPGSDRRRGIYQLYYLLVHVNLFGGSYSRRTRETLRSVLGAESA